MQKASISRHKLKDYLLDKDHPLGGPKAAFFIANGFSPKNPEKLAKALLLHAERGQVSATTDTGYGIKYIIEGDLLAPNGQALKVVAVWLLDQEEGAPRLVTAYPAKVRSHGKTA